MLERGFLASTAFYASYANKDEHIEKYYKTVDQVFGIIAIEIKSGNPEERLEGPICHSGFQRLT